MTTYRVSIWASYEVQANSEQEAKDMVHDLVQAGEISMKEYEFTAEESDNTEPENY